MELSDFRRLKSRAAEALENASFDHRRLVLLHIGISSALLLALAVIELLLQNQIAGTSGLSGIGPRTILETMQTILQTTTSLALPFWEFGYLFMLLRLERGQDASFSTLLGGFRHFGPVLRFIILQALLYIGLGFLVFYPSLMIFTATPLSGKFMNVMEPILLSGTAPDPYTLLQDPAIFAAISEALRPMLILYSAVYFLCAVPLVYRLRLAQLALVDNPAQGAGKALRKSARLMKRNCIRLFKLDLSFWWFYLLEGVMTVICYGDQIAPMLGIRLPFGEDMAYIVFYALNLVGQVALYYFARNYVMATYAAVYDTLNGPGQAIDMPSV